MAALIGVAAGLAFLTLGIRKQVVIDMMLSDIVVVELLLTHQARAADPPCGASSPHRPGTRCPWRPCQPWA
jgi:hypothetical protein